LESAENAARCVSDSDGREAHGAELPSPAFKIGFEFDALAVLAPARPRRTRRHAAGVDRDIRRAHGPPFGLGYGFIADDEHPDAGSGAPIVVLRKQ
jgi:hypothetical protein